MIDVKKLVTGFLILATIAVCSGLAFSFFTSGSKTGGTAVAQPSIANNDTAPVQTNAFVDTGSVQGNAAELLSDIDTSSTDVVTNDPSNLTNILADSFVTGLNTANPNGLTMSQNGVPDITAPDTQSIAESIASNPEVEGLVIPDWDTEAQSQLIDTIPSASQNSITQYSSALNAVFAKDFVSSGVQSEVTNSAANGDPSQLPFIASQIQSALTDTLAIPTPTPLVGLQESLVRVMVYEKNLSLLGEDSSNDPVKASLVFQGEKAKFDSAKSVLQQQIEKASSLGLSLNARPQARVPLIAKIFGVRTAEAQEITFDPDAFAQMIEEYLNNIILQILKNLLVSVIQKKVLTAIQGSGAPQFVQSFAAQMINSYQSAAINTINSEIAQTPPSQQAALKALTSISYQAPNGASVLGTIGPNSGVSVSGNFTNMSDYLSEYNSGGNVWANAMAIHDSAMAAGTNNQTANQTQNIAQQGWKGSLTCSDGSDPTNGVHYTCADNTIPDPVFHYCDGNANIAAQAIPNAGQCANGNPPTTIMPGQVTGQQSNAALQIGGANITSANDIAGLLNSMLTSLLNTLAQNAINYANSAVNGVLNTQNPNNSGITGVSSSSLTNNGNTSSATQAAVQCLPSVQSVTRATSTGMAFVNLSATGGKIDTQCVINNDCPTTENSDGTPIYNWIAYGSSQTGYTNTALTGQSLLLTYSTPGNYTATVTASTDNSQSTCQITVQ